jgi:2-oxo-hept-3-ene-1,7-dioate hydratase
MGTHFDQAALADIAARLDKAGRDRTQIGQLSALHPDLTIKDAYAIQNAWLEMKLAAGRVVKGHKIGLTSRAMQMAIGIDEPDYGFLLDDMFFGDGARLPSDRFIEPRVEAELAFVLEAPLSGPDCTLFDVLNATDYVVPALEILDARILRSDPETGRTRTVIDTISDNAANAALVIGGRPFRPLDADLRWIAALCYRNGQIEESGVAAAVLNHPANGIAWLANRLAPHGVSLKAGEIVLSGSFIRPIDARRGDTFHADYGPYGSVSCQFV